MGWFSLTSTQSCRRLVLALSVRDIAILSFFDFTSKELDELYIPSTEHAVIKWVVDVAPNVLLISTGIWWNVVNVSDHKVVATFRACEIDLRLRPRLFYLSSKGLLLVIFKNVIKCFKIHNIENCLTSYRCLTSCEIFQAFVTKIANLIKMVQLGGIKFGWVFCSCISPTVYGIGILTVTIRVRKQMGISFSWTFWHFLQL